MLPCLECPKTYVSKNALSEHVMGVHRELKSKKCPMCPFVSAHRATISAHKRRHHRQKESMNIIVEEAKSGNDPPVENTSDLDFLNAPPVKMVSKAEINGNYQCEHCQKSYSRPGRLKAHENAVHLGLRPYQCSGCDCTFRYKNNHSAHVRKVHASGHVKENSNPKFQCQDCSETFSEKDVLFEHVMGTHQGLQVLKCPECPFVSANDSAMSQHEKLHRGTTKPTERKECENVSASVRSTTKDKIERKYSCEHCPKFYSSARNLKDHVNAVHLGSLRPYRCPECDYCTSYRGALYIHKARKHRGKQGEPVMKDLGDMTAEDSMPENLQDRDLNNDKATIGLLNKKAGEGSNADERGPVGDVCPVCGFHAETPKHLTAHILATHVDR